MMHKRYRGQIVAAANIQISVAAIDKTDIANSPPNVANQIARHVGHIRFSYIVKHFELAF
jgi:hypothetical protein